MNKILKRPALVFFCALVCAQTVAPMARLKSLSYKQIAGATVSLFLASTVAHLVEEEDYFRRDWRVRLPLILVAWPVRAAWYALTAPFVYQNLQTLQYERNFYLAEKDSATALRDLYLGQRDIEARGRERAQRERDLRQSERDGARQELCSARVERDVAYEQRDRVKESEQQLKRTRDVELQQNKALEELAKHMQIYFELNDFCVATKSGWRFVVNQYNHIPKSALIACAILRSQLCYIFETGLRETGLAKICESEWKKIRKCFEHAGHIDFRFDTVSFDRAPLLSDDVLVRAGLYQKGACVDALTILKEVLIFFDPRKQHPYDFGKTKDKLSDEVITHWMGL